MAEVDPCVMCGEPSGAASLSMFILNDSVTGRTWGGVSPGHLRLCEECVWKLDEIGATAISRAIRGSMIDLTEGRGPQVMEELRFHVSLLQSGAAHNKHNCNSCWTLWALEDQRSEIDFARQLANGVYPDELANQFGGMGLEDRPLGKAIADLHLEIAALKDAREQIEGYRQALERAMEALNAENARTRRRHSDPQFAPMVRDLGKRIGYGVLMTEASRLWALNVGGGAFAVGHCIAIVEAADREARRVLAGKEAKE